MSVRGWTVVFEGYWFQADLVAAALQAQGVRAEVFGDHGFGPAISLSNGARILVPDEDAAAARRIIKEAEGQAPPPEDV